MCLVGAKLRFQQTGYKQEVNLQVDTLPTTFSLYSVHKMITHGTDPVCLSVCLPSNSQTNGQLLMKFGTDIMALEATPKSYLL
jgi:hypothetical protein